MMKLVYKLKALGQEAVNYFTRGFINSPSKSIEEIKGESLGQDLRSKASYTQIRTKSHSDDKDLVGTKFFLKRKTKRQIVPYKQSTGIRRNRSDVGIYASHAISVHPSKRRSSYQKDTDCLDLLNETTKLLASFKSDRERFSVSSLFVSTRDLGAMMLRLSKSDSNLNGKSETLYKTKKLPTSLTNCTNPNMATSSMLVSAPQFQPRFSDDLLDDRNLASKLLEIPKDSNTRNVNHVPSSIREIPRSKTSSCIISLYDRCSRIRKASLQLVNSFKDSTPAFRNIIRSHRHKDVGLEQLKILTTPKTADSCSKGRDHLNHLKKCSTGESPSRPLQTFPKSRTDYISADDNINQNDPKKTEAEAETVERKCDSECKHSKDKSNTNCCNTDKDSIHVERDNEIIPRKSFILSYNGPLYNLYDFTDTHLGIGSYGCVIEAIHKATKSPRAIKVIQKTSAENRDHLQREIAMLKCLDHPNIIKLYETFEDEDHACLCLELCTGGELFDRIVEMRRFSEKTAAHVITQIFSALGYCHAMGVVHRDVKPENFMFFTRSIKSPIKMIDFGLSNRCTIHDILNSRVGTPYYASPDVLLGRASYKSDIWSTGVMLYVLLSGSPPFWGKNNHEILEKIRFARYNMAGPCWQKVSGEAKDLISKLLARNPSDRLSATEALSHPWVKMCASSSPSVTKVDMKIIANFKRFFAYTRLQRIVLTILAQQLTSGQCKELEENFTMLDKNKDGILNNQEIISSLEPLNIEELRELSVILESVDSDKSGGIDYTEFVAAGVDLNTIVTRGRLILAFQILDYNGDGKLSPIELAKVITRGNCTKCQQKSLKEARELIELYDKNGDGILDFVEFQEMMRI